MSRTIVDCTSSQWDDAVGLYRRTMGRLAGGVAVILSGTRGAPVGMTVNSLISVSLDPLLLLFCARIRSATAATISRNGAFSVNILSDKQIDASVHFAGKRGHFDEHSLQCRGEHIWMSDTEGSILCSVERIDRAGDHDIIIGRVEHIVACSASRSPLIYHEGQYYSLGDAHAMPQAPRAPALCPIAASVEEGHP